MAKDNFIHIRITDDMKDKLIRHTKAKGITITWFIEKLIKGVLNEDNRQS